MKNPFKFAATPKPQIREQHVPQEVHAALRLLKTRMLKYEHLRRAMIAAVDGGEGAIHAYCEDFGLDQVDPVTRMDVLKHALQATTEGIALG